jgi:LuxR family transcriptional regulator
MDRRSPAGFAAALHIRFTRPTYLFQTYAKRWNDHYSATGAHMYDPVVRWGLQNTGRVLWSDLAPYDEMGVLEQAKDFGLMNGVGFAVLIGDSRSIVACARADRDFDEEEIAELERLVIELHELTAGPGRLSPADEHALTELSIRLTR